MYGQMVKDRRKKLGLTQIAFAKQCGISHSTVGSIEQGRHDATFQTRQIIDRVLFPQDAKPEPYGARLSLKRKARALTLTMLADRVGSNPSFLSEVEKGYKYPSVALSERINVVLGEF